MKCKWNFRVFGLCLSALLPVVVAQAQAHATDKNPPARVAHLTQLAGQVSIEPAGANHWTAASVNTSLAIGDRLYTNRDGRAELQMGRTVVHIWRETDLSVANLTNTTTRLGLSQGSLHVRTFRLNPNRTVEVDTPNGAITAMQPGDFRVDAYMGDGGTVVTVNSGAVQIRGPGVSQSLGTGQSVRLEGSNPITATLLSMPGKDPFDARSRQRDRKLLASPTRQAPR